MAPPGPPDDGQPGARGRGGRGAVLPVFVLDDDVLAHASPVRVSFLLDALSSLRERYRALGGDLLVVEGDPADALVRVADGHEEDRVVWNADPATVHAWPDLDDGERAAAAPGYPPPVVDNAERREAALEAFRAARGE